MQEDNFSRLKLEEIETPCFVVDERIIEKNLNCLDNIQKKSGSKILLALKAYALHKTFPLIKEKLYGVCVGSLYEARLGKEEFGKEVHTYSPAFKDEEFSEIIDCSDRIIFNSISQFERFMPTIKSSNKKIKVGLRVNPEKSVAGELYSVYDPCAKNSGLGVIAKNLQGKNLEEITGLHFHALCEQGTDELEKVLGAFGRKFDSQIKKASWVNFGGGHHITKKGYDSEKLIKMIADFREKYPNIKEIYLEPGEAVVLNSGALVSSVLDVTCNGKKTAVLDTSVETHFPDVLITKKEPRPYIQPILGAEIARKGEIRKGHKYTLRGVSCAAGDIFGDYYFPKPLKAGDKLIFSDAAHYTMVKVSTFCGVNIPSIALMNADGSVKMIKKFGYNDYKARLS